MACLVVLVRDTSSFLGHYGCMLSLQDPSGEGCFISTIMLLLLSEIHFLILNVHYPPLKCHFPFPYEAVL